MRRQIALWAAGILGTSLVLLLLIAGLSFGFNLASLRTWIAQTLPATRPDRPIITSTAPPVIELEKVGQLATMKVHVVDILEGKGLGYRGIWLVSGDATLAVDLATARFEDSDPATKRSVLVLPRMKVESPRVDHEKTRTYDFKSNTWLPWKKGDQSELRDQAMVQAQRLVGYAAGRESNFVEARKSCESLIKSLYAEVGWNVDVRWEEKTDQPQVLSSDLSPKAGDAVVAESIVSPAQQ